MPDAETPVKEHWKTREARLRREAVSSGAEADSVPDEGERAQAIADALKASDAPPAETFTLAPNPTGPTIESRVGLPPSEHDTLITPDMTPEDVEMLVSKAARFVAPKAAPAGRVRTTTFVNTVQSKPEVVETRFPSLKAVPRNEPVVATVNGETLDFVEFVNRRFTQMDAGGATAIYQSSQPHPAFAQMKKLYVAYIACVRRAAEAMDCAGRGQMD